MDALTPQDLLKMQRKATRRGYLGGFIAGVITTSVIHIYNQLVSERDRNRGFRD